MSTHHRRHDHHGAHHEEAPHHHGHSHADEDMLSVEEAYERVMASFAPLEPVEVPLLEALGQTLAEDVTSPLALPPLANSGMDGYALQGADIAGASQDSPRRLPVVGIVAAGQMPERPVEAGVAVRIMTGAPVPDGADTVVPFEETDEVQRKREGRPLDEVVIFSEMPVGANVRPAGEDVSAGELVLEAGTVIRAAEVGVLASLGLDRVRVVRRPVVSVLATGDELETAGSTLSGGKIYDSNSFSVAASVVASGGVPRLLGIARDNLDDLHAKLAATAGSDLVITSAGVSKGDYDIVKDVLEQRGSMNFWSVRMRPAKPLAFGHLRGEGGPGNTCDGAPAWPAGQPGQRHGGLRDVRTPRHPRHAGPPCAGPSGGGRHPHRAHTQLRRPPRLRAGGGGEARRRVLRQPHRTPGLQHSDLDVAGQRARHLPRGPARQTGRRAGSHYHAGLERRGGTMTIAGPESAGAPEESLANSRRYQISLQRLEQLNRSALHLFHTRLTEACPSHGLPVGELEPATLMREIREFHADSGDFIRPDMPIQEILFRTLLARGNDPLTLGELHRELTETWSSALRPISIDAERLQRVIEADTYYGFAQV